MAETKKTSPLATLVIVAGVVTAGLALSYCQQLPKYAFEREAAQIDELPGTRLIDTVKTGELTSPVTWFRPNETTWRYAVPDLIHQGRFAVLAFHYEHDPSAYMVDADCSSRELSFAGLDEPEEADPMRDIFGRPVVAGDGRVYRLINSSLPTDQKLVGQFCDTDWTPELTELRNAARS